MSHLTEAGALQRVDIGESAGERLHSAVLALFAITLFVSAALLFTVQPMFAKMVLPLLGGTPAVWITCMVFFQATLLAGYAYAHATTALSAHRQAAIHFALLLAPLLVLPVAVPAGWHPPAQHNPLMWLLALMLVALGLPFFVVSTTAPLVQTWFGGTDHPGARDPYFLYGASNAGSLVGLLAYPTLIEPNLRLANQSRLWTAGYVLLTALLVSCAVVRRSHASVAPAVAALRGAGRARLRRAQTEPVPVWLCFRWALLAFLPSSLMLGLSTYLSSNVAPMPLFWVVPLALYLLTFVLAFGRKARVSYRLMNRLMAILILPLTMTMSFGGARPLWVLVVLHVLTVFVASMICHGELARSRPSADRLTEFFLWVAAGGVLGGVFNALIAPLIFRGVVEYPLALVAACLVRFEDRSGPPKAIRGWELVAPLVVGGVVFGLVQLVKAVPIVGVPGRLLIGGIPALLCFAIRHRPVAFGLGVGALMVTTTLLIADAGLRTLYPERSADAGQRTLYRERSFFGVWRVQVDSSEKLTMLFSGPIEHGRQSLDPARQAEPLSYFHRTGPIGQVFATFSRSGMVGRVAVIGLGTGSLACHGTRGQQFTFYEIDPAVVRIASDPRYFTFLQVCPPEIRIVLGDARSSLATAPDHHYGLIVLDAFSADTIPTHLLTRQALRLYLRKLADPGLIAFHISNFRLDLEPTVGNLAHDAGLIALGQFEAELSDDAWRAGKVPSHWVALARRPEDLGALAGDRRWQALPPRPDKTLWTDDFSNMFETIRWR